MGRKGWWVGRQVGKDMIIIIICYDTPDIYLLRNILISTGDVTELINYIRIVYYYST